ncbi:MAG: SMC-Scp complex subunit ScpB [Chloroflexi bacterium]|nr:SMC-Scp complex subunit ScpB [Chloroflexota bacterium]
MELDQLCCLVESLLFASDGPIEVSRLQQVLEVEKDQLDQALEVMAAQSHARGIRLQRLGQAVQVVTAPEAAPYVEKLLGVQQNGRLSPAAIETLAIVAYQQPITRAGIEAVRGVNSDRALTTLQARGLVAEVGRLDTVGRPMLFGTTFEFLQCFGLDSLDQLPPLQEEGVSPHVPSPSGRGLG